MSFSLDGGINWNNYSVWPFSNNPFSGLAIDPKNTNTKYACTGNGGLFVYKGDSPIPQKWTELEGNCKRIAIDQDNSKNVMTNSLNFSADGGWTWNKKSDVSVGSPYYYKGNKLIIGGMTSLLESIDGGSSWNILRKYPEKGSYVYINKENPNYIFVSNLSTSGDRVIIVFSSDMGKTWKTFASYKFDNNIRIPGDNILMVNENGVDAVYVGYKGLFKSVDYGKTWSQVNSISTESVLPISYYNSEGSDESQSLSEDAMKKYFGAVEAITYDISAEGSRSGQRTEKLNTKVKIKVQKNGNIDLVEIITNKDRVNSYIKDNWSLYTDNVTKQIAKLKSEPIYLDEQNVSVEGVITIPTVVTINIVAKKVDTSTKSDSYPKKKRK